MDKSNQLTLESGIRKLIVTGIALFSLWWKMNHGSEPNATVLTLITDNVLPVIVPGLAIATDTLWSRFRIKEASLKIDTALQLPSGTTNAQLNDVVAKVKEIKSVLPELPLEHAVDQASQGIVK